MNIEEIEEELSDDERADFDGIWKEAIERFLPELLQRTLPELYHDADFSIPPEFLSKELSDSIQRPASDEHNPSLFVDELIKIYLKNGQTEWLLLHIEIQGSGGKDISFRMTLYCSLIFAHHRKMPVALAILTKPRPKKENIGTFSSELYGTKLTYNYNCFEVYNQDEKELAESDNPFDLIFLAAKKAMKIRGKNKELKKYRYLLEAVRLLSQKGFNENDRRDIFIFIARLVNLKNIKLQQRLKKDIEGSEKMRTLSWFEEMYRDEAMRKAQREANLATARRLRSAGFNDDDIQRFTELSLDDIHSLDLVEA